VSALGPRGMTVLSIAGIAGVFLGILGWTQRGTGLVAPLVSPSASPSAASSPSAPASPSAAASGPAPRVSAAVASVLLLEIVISLSVSGLSDTSMRDVGVLGLAVCLTGCRNQRLVLRD
jgi:hypothetical protein